MCACPGRFSNRCCGRLRWLCFRNIRCGRCHIRCGDPRPRVGVCCVGRRACWLIGRCGMCCLSICRAKTVSRRFAERSRGTITRPAASNDAGLRSRGLAHVGHHSLDRSRSADIRHRRNATGPAVSGDRLPAVSGDRLPATTRNRPATTRLASRDQPLAAGLDRLPASHKRPDAAPCDRLLRPASHNSALWRISIRSIRTTGGLRPQIPRMASQQRPPRRRPQRPRRRQRRADQRVEQRRFPHARRAGQRHQQRRCRRVQARQDCRAEDVLNLRAGVAGCGGCREIEGEGDGAHRRQEGFHRRGQGVGGCRLRHLRTPRDIRSACHPVV
jgi:hypothetical protein